MSKRKPNNATAGDVTSAGIPWSEVPDYVHEDRPRGSKAMIDAQVPSCDFRIVAQAPG